ncbi:MAG TPA: cohesin domain-containing protein [archaeon]|nr:cohesin domain-containing protein [archaeon]
MSASSRLKLRPVKLFLLVCPLLFLLVSSSHAANSLFLGSAEAKAGGSDTLDVFLTTEKAFPAAEISLKFDPSKLSFREGSLTVNPQVWKPEWGRPIVSVYPNGIKIAFLSMSNLEAAIPKGERQKLFSVVLTAKAGIPAGEKLELEVKGMLTDAQFNEIGLESSQGSFTVIGKKKPEKKEK